MLIKYHELHPETVFNIPILSFSIIGIGSFSCVLGGYISRKMGVKKTAFSFLLLSCICCIISPFMFQLVHRNLFITFLLFWGMMVIADSPLLSTLVAQNAKAEVKGAALTIVNSIGFAITIISIQLMTVLTSWTDSGVVYTLLAIGPVVGLVALRRSK